MSVESIRLADMAKGLVRDEFVYYYQPKISMISGKICGAEALIRWQKPDGSNVMPNDFIPLAEETGFITEITQTMLPKLLADIALISNINSTIRVAFNASTKDFESPILTEVITRHVDQFKNAGNIEVEITEASLLSSDEEIRKNLYSLPEAGIPLAMDDFTAGFSNIERLSTHPFSTLKLDRKIVQRIWESNKDASIVQSSIRLAHKLGLEIVAEGVENWRIYHFLLNAGCTQGQGFWISKPLPLMDFLDLLKDSPHWPALPVGLLHMAELDHIEWRKSLLDMVFFLEHCDADNLEKSMPRHLPELNYMSCGLGKWYYGPGQEFVDNDYYNALEAPHKSLHETGRRLLQAAVDGQPRAVIEEYLHRLSEESALIIQLLQTLQNRAISELGNLNPDRVRSYFSKDFSTITFPVLRVDEAQEIKSKQ